MYEVILLTVSHTVYIYETVVFKSATWPSYAARPYMSRVMYRQKTYWWGLSDHAQANVGSGNAVLNNYNLIVFGF